MNRSVYSVLLSGLILRLGLAPFTGHPYDLGSFTTSLRLYYQYGTLDLHYYPTLPLLYYVQLIFYAPYDLLRVLGVPDSQFYYHTTLMLETVFLKLPLILCDVGIFFVLFRFTGKLFPATLFFLNPFPIYLSSVWGTYDSLMLFPLVLGIYLYGREKKGGASVSFVLSGLLKLFGFISFAMIFAETIVRRRFRTETLLGLIGGLVISGLVVLPTFFFGGFDVFLNNIVYRFIGGGRASAGGARWNLFEVLLNINPSGAFPTIPVIVALVCVAYIYETRKGQKQATALVKWTLVGAIGFALFSASEPQWLSWLVPFGILYGYTSGRIGLQYFSYVFGVVQTFLTMTLLQNTGYLLLGSGYVLVGYVENLPAGSFLYAVVMTIMVGLFSCYAFVGRLRSFRIEIVPLVILIYLQAYFWIVIVGVGRFVGVS